MKAIVASSNTVALDFGRALFGPIGGSLFAVVVAFSCFGALNGTFFSLFMKFTVYGCINCYSSLP